MLDSDRLIRIEDSRINLNLLGVKAKTKKKIYWILTTETELYLPPQKETSIYSVCDIIQKKNRIDYFN